MKKLLPEKSWWFMPLLFLCQAELYGQHDVALSSRISGTTVSKGSNVTFTVVVKNEGQTNLTGVKIQNTIPDSAVWVSSNTNGIGTYNSGTHVWDIGAISNTTDTLVLTVTVRIIGDGVIYHKAEVLELNETDIDSAPNNVSVIEDDYTAACVTVPMLFCSGSNINVSMTAPVGYANYKFFKNGVQVQDSVANVYTINSIGSYTYETLTATGCVASLCCPVTVDTMPLPIIRATNATICQGLNVNLAALVADINPNTALGGWGYFATLQAAQDSTGALASSTVNPNGNTTYYIRRSYGSCYVTASVTITVNPLPTAGVISATVATCSVARTPNDDAKIELTGFTNGTKVSYGTSAAGFYFATATAMTNGALSITGLSNPVGATTYLLRIYSADSTCYKDTTVLLNPTTCPCSSPDLVLTGSRGFTSTDSVNLATTGFLDNNAITGVITYHNSLTDAVNGTNPIANTTRVGVSGQYWIRKTAMEGVGTCYDTVSVFVTISVSNDLAISKRASVSTSNIGSPVSFTITVKNQGRTHVTGVQVTDSIPAGTTWLSDNSAGAYSPVTGIWNIGNIASTTDSVSLTINLRIDGDGVIFNTAEITAMDGTDMDSAPNNRDVTEDDIASACISVPMIFCARDVINVMLTAPSGYANYRWLKNGAEVQNSASNTYNATSVGQYVFETNTPVVSCAAAMCCPLIVDTLPRPNIQTSDDVICYGRSKDISTAVTETNGATVTGTWSFFPTWKDAKDSTNSLSSTTVTPLVTTKYYVRRSYGTCYDTDSLMITVHPKPNAGSDTTLICNAGVSNSTYNFNQTGLWSVVSQPALSAAVTNTGSASGMTVVGDYDFEFTDGNGCKDTARISVRTCPCPMPNLAWTGANGGQATAVCAPQRVDIALLAFADSNSVTGTVTYHNLEADALSGNNPMASTQVNTSGTYWIRKKATNGTGDCFDTMKITVVVNPKPVFGDGVQTICENTLVDLTTLVSGIGAANTTRWMTGSYNGIDVNNPAAIYPALPGLTYYFVGTTMLGCADSATVIINVHPKPELGITRIQACNGGLPDSTLNFNINGTWRIFAQPVNGRATVNINSGLVEHLAVAGDYDIEISNIHGCKDTVRINVPNCACANPELVVTSIPAPVCAPAFLNLTQVSVNDNLNISGTIAYFATANDAVNNTNPLTDTRVYESATYWIRKTSNVGAGLCYDTVRVNMVINPKPDFGNATRTICEGDALNLTHLVSNYALSTGSRAWALNTFSGQSVANELLVHPAVPATGYYFVGSTAEGCRDSAIITVNVNSKPNLGEDNVFICHEGVVDNDYDFEENGTWRVLTQPLNATATVTSAGFVAGLGLTGNYVFEFINSNICKDTVQITIPPCPCSPPSLLLSNQPAPICAPDSINLAMVGVTDSNNITGITTYHTTASDASTGANPMISTKVGVTGIYWVRKQSTNGAGICYDTIRVAVTVNPKPNVGLDSLLVCSPQGIAPNTYHFNQTGTWNMYNKPVLATATISNAGLVQNMQLAGLYDFEYVDLNQCKDSVRITIPNCVNPCDCPSRQDLVAPTIQNVPQNITVTCPRPQPATVTATDNCTAAQNIVITLAETVTDSTHVQRYKLTRIWTATDACGNTATASQIVIVKDTTAPMFAGVLTNEVSVCILPAIPTVNASDNCGADVTITYSQVVSDSVNRFKYTVTRLWTATDENGNARTMSQVVRLNDSIPPVFAGVPANVTVNCDNIPSVLNPTFTDNCDQQPTLTYSQSRTDGNCLNNYTLTRTWVATDGCNNVATTQQTIVVQDITRPTLVGMPSNVSVSCMAIPAPATVTATDNCGLARVSMTQVANGDSTLLTRTWTATDSCGNVTTGTQLVAIDRTACTPVLYSSVENRVWEDTDGDGIQDPSESSIPNVIVLLEGVDENGASVTLRDTTDANGLSRFEDLLSGTYHVTYLKPIGYEFTYPSQGTDSTLNSDANPWMGNSPNFVLGKGVNETTFDAGLYRPATIGDLVWADTSRNGLKEAGEIGLPNVLVTLLGTTPDGTQLTLVDTTDANGLYLFEGLRPGVYQLDVELLHGYEFSPQGANLNGTDDSNINPQLGVTPQITLVSGETNRTIDAGLLPPIAPLKARIGYLVWEDKNGNGIVDPNEPGIGNVLVTLTGTDSTGAPVTLQVRTEPTGHYAFDDLLAGTYTLTFTAPNGMNFTYPNQGNNDVWDSDVNPNGVVSNLTVRSGESNFTVHAGLYTPAKLGDLVWLDQSQNGLQAAGEAGIANVTVNLTGTTGNGTDVNLTMTTNANGLYLFEGLRPGQYQVSFVQPAGLEFTTQGNNPAATDDSNVNTLTGLSQTVTLVSGDDNRTIDAGLFRPIVFSSVGNKVWIDADGDGIQDATELGLSNVIVLLQGTDANGNPVTLRDTTDANGLYRFDNLLPGTYSVTYSKPIGYEFTYPTQGADLTLNSDANPQTGSTPNFVLGAGVNEVGLDAGFYQPAKLGDLVWLDNNRNGSQAIGEIGVANVIATLTGTTATGEQVSFRDTTDANGLYLFEGLRPGQYQVSFAKPAGLEFTVQGDNPSTTDDSNVNTQTGLSQPITLISGADNRTIDAGLIRPIVLSSVGNKVWEDMDGDGIQDGTESGLANVIVLLDGTDVNGNPVTLRDTTDVNGFYRFDNLLSGTYHVTYLKPTGYEYTYPSQGTDSTLNSDANPWMGNTPDFVLGEGINEVNLDAGFYRPATIGDLVWADTSRNGVKEAGEIGLPNVLVTLFGTTADGTQLTLLDTTDANGLYLFENLRPGVYQMDVELLHGYEFSPQGANVNGSEDSNINPQTGVTQQIALVSGENNRTIDAGLLPPIAPLKARIGYLVWEDKNGNGIVDPNEPGIGNVLVTLTGTDSTGAPVTLQVRTEPTGHYAFDDLWAGTYTLTFTAPNGMNFTYPNQGNDDLLDSDVNPNGVFSNVGVRSGESNFTVHAGLYTPAKLGDWVWLDSARNGLQTGTGGISNVTVNLTGTTGNGTAVTLTATTDANGLYAFEGLRPGQYQVSFIKPAGLEFTTQGNNPAATDDSNANIQTGVSQSVTLVSGDVNSTIDAGLIRPIVLSSIGNKIWEDTDGDGVQDANEAGLPQVIILLTGTDAKGNPVTLRDTTDANGLYRFDNLLSGSYTIKVLEPTGYDFTHPSQGNDGTLNSDFNPITGESLPIVLLEGQNVMDYDAGLYRPAKLGDLVWMDNSRNGLQTAGEVGVANVVVTLIGTMGNGMPIMRRDTTDSDGLYLFEGLHPGQYQVTFAKPAGLEFTTQGNNPTTTDDSNTDTQTGVSPFVTLFSGDDNRTIDAGLIRPVLFSSVGNKVWEDANGDGIQDVTESGLGGVIVLLEGTDVLGNPVTLRDTTDANGLYLFDELLGGTYHITYLKPIGYEYTFPSQGTDSTLNSDANPWMGNTPDFVLAEGFNDLSLDAGFYRPASLGDLVWGDTSRNGLKEAGERGLPNVLVTLLGTLADGSDITLLDTTDANGFYLFENLRPGVYQIDVERPHGYEFSPQVANGNGPDDSNIDPQIGVTSMIPLMSGENNRTIDAGLMPPTEPLKARIGYLVWEDRNGNGIVDLNEPGLGNVLITLTGMDVTGAQVTKQVTTDPAGHYFVEDLLAGTYSLTFTAPNGMTFTYPNQGNNDLLDSDVNPNGVVNNVVVQSGESNITIHAGLYTPAKLGDFVWLDNSRNGLQTAGEAGVPNVIVNLTGTTGNGTAITLTTTTDANGLYLFDTLRPGQYQVSFVKPVGLEFTTEGNNAASTDDSNVNRQTGVSQSVTLISGEDNRTIDAGLIRPLALSSIGNKIWEDTDGDGIQDLDEAGLSRVVILLTGTDINGNPVTLRDTTDVNGLYSFDNLLSGSYTIKVLKPTGYEITYPNQGNNPALNSDCDPITGQTSNIVLIEGQTETGYDAGLYRPAKLGDLVWLDDSRNGLQGAGEPGVANVIVTLVGVTGNRTQVNLRDTTDANGFYLFENLRPGQYRVSFIKPAGLEFTTQGGSLTSTDDSNVDTQTGLAQQVTLLSGADNRTIDAGLIRPIALSSVGNKVWEDTDGDGVQDVTETGLANVIVLLQGTDANGNTVTLRDTTDGNGLYRFDNLLSGTYQITYSKPTGYEFTYPTQGTDSLLNSDANIQTGKTATFVLGEGRNDMSYDAGFYRPTTIGDLVWADTSRNGLKEAGEIGLPNVLVTLYGTKPDGTLITLLDTTDANGLYLFENLHPGVYQIDVELLHGYGFSPQGANANGTDDSNIDPQTGGTPTFTILSGETNRTIDAGLLPPVGVLKARIGYLVWEDKNGNGIVDPNEPGIGDVLVTLTGTDSTGASITRTVRTEPTGHYAFNDLLAGTYNITCTAPNGMIFTYSNQGNDDVVDSDVNPNGVVNNVVIRTSESNFTVHAGLYTPVKLGDFVWMDNSRNGLQTAGEAGIPNVTVNLTGTTGNGTAVTLTTTTDANGLYLFDGLRPGQYQVSFIKPVGLEFTTQGNNPAATEDSNVNPQTGVTPFVTLISGVDNRTLDAGLMRPILWSSIGNKVWEDADGDGMQDGTEAGLGQMVVLLTGTDANGNTVTLRDTTDANGLYRFDNLLSGIYTVKILKPAGYEFTYVNQNGVDAALNSDINPATGETQQIVLGEGQNEVNYDAGLYRAAKLGDLVWMDNSRNGLQAAGEAGVPNVTVNLTGTTGNGTPVILRTTTDANGYYLFEGLRPGQYQVSFVRPIGLEFTTQGDNPAATDDSKVNVQTGLATQVTLQSGEENRNIDAGLVLPLEILKARIGNFVWEDKNGNGLVDPNEAGIAGVLVTLTGTDSTGAAVTRQVTTNATGQYLFENLLTGTYNIQFTAPNGMSFTYQNQGNNDLIDCDVNPNGVVSNIAVRGGELNMTVHAGLYTPAKLGDLVWLDDSRNGLKDAAEVGVSNVIVQLTGTTGNGTAVTLTATTNANGLYLFEGLRPGQYQVSFTKPAGLEFTAQGNNPTATDDSNVNPQTGISQTVTLISGDHNSTIDAGLMRPISLSSIGNKVWEDMDGDGIQDVNELGIAGFIVLLTGTDVNGNPITLRDTTDANGLYSFDNLLSGTYKVTYLKSTGYEFTYVNQGTDVTLNSDADPITGQTPAIIIGEGQQETGFDAGFYRPAKIGDLAWVDDSRNGLKDVTEAGLANVIVTLTGITGNGTPVAITDTTDANGLYLFENLIPGRYSVTFSKAIGYSFTTQSNNPTGDNDSNPDANTGQTATLNLMSGVNNRTIDVGYTLPIRMSIGNLVWNDNNNNGKKDGTEVGIPGVKVTLMSVGNDGLSLTNDDTLIDTFYTGANGNYLFTNVLAGDYYVMLSNVPTGIKSSTGNGPTDTGNTGSYEPSNIGDVNEEDHGAMSNGRIYSQIVHLTANQLPTNDGDTDNNTNLTIDFGLYVPQIVQTLSIGNSVWNDANNNGIKDANESGLPNVRLGLYTLGNDGQSNTADDVQVTITTTTANGNYLFTNLNAGTYFIQVLEGVPTGMYSSTGDGMTDTDGVGAYEPANVGDQNDKDHGTDLNTITFSNNIELILNQEPVNDGDTDANTNLTMDFGFYTPQVSQRLTLGNSIWNDGNNNGIKEANESGLADVKLGLYNLGNDGRKGTADDVVIDSTISNVNGNYLFLNLSAGAYYVKVHSGLPQGMVSSTGDGVSDMDGQGAYEPSTTGDADGRDHGSRNPEGITTGIIELTVGGEPVNDGDNDANTNLTVDLGFYRPVPPSLNIGNLVWNDANNNGKRDVGEAGLEDIEILLCSAGNDGVRGTADDSRLDSLLTDANGGYLFTNLPEGNYFVKVKFGVPTGMRSSTGNGIYDRTGVGAYEPGITSSNNEEDHGTQIGGGLEAISGVFHLAPNTQPITDGDNSPHTNLTIDFGFYAPQTLPTLSLGNSVWNDANNNGIKDSGEAGIANVIVQLSRPGLDGVIGTVDDITMIRDTTDAAGAYRFDGLSPNDYYVRLIAGIPTGMRSSTGNGITDTLYAGAFEPGVNTDLNNRDHGTRSGTTIVSNIVTLTVGGEPTNDGDTDANTNLTIDLGLYKPQTSNPVLKLGNLVWFDENNNGKKEAAEEGIPGVEVILYKVGADAQRGTADDVEVGRQLTNLTGNYLFATLAAGDYYVKLNNGLQTLASSTGDGRYDLDGAGLYEPSNIGKINNQDHGTQQGNTIVSQIITLTVNGEPTNDGDANSNTNLTADFGLYKLVPNGVLDLALIDRLGDNEDIYAAEGDTVKFTMMVLNQGTRDAYNVKVKGYLPNTMTYYTHLNTIARTNNANPWAADTTCVIPSVRAGDSVKIDMWVIAAPLVVNKMMVHKAEITFATDQPNGLVNTQDVDSQADSNVSNDIVGGDNVISNRNNDEDDHDYAGVVAIRNFDPLGYIYCDKTKKIVQGGTINVTGPGLVFIHHDGHSGFYQWWTDGTPGLYTMTYSHPDGYPMSVRHLPAGNFLDPTGLDGSPRDRDGLADSLFTLGSVANPTLTHLADTTFAANPYYMKFELETGDPFINFNNVPVQCGSIGTLVFVDLNSNNVLNNTDILLDSVRVDLFECTNTVDILSTGRTEHGRWTFDGLVANDYTVRFTPPAGYEIVTANIGGQELADSDANPITGFTACIPLAYGECDTIHARLGLRAIANFCTTPNVESRTGNLSTCTQGGVQNVSIRIDQPISSYTITGSAGYRNVVVSGQTIRFETILNGNFNNIGVTLNTPGGCSVTDNFTYELANVPIANFTVIEPFCRGEEVKIVFTGRATAGAQLNYNLNGGRIVRRSAGTATRPLGDTTVVIWDEYGGKVLRLDVNDGGCTDSKTVSILIKKALRTDVIKKDTTVCPNACVVLRTTAANNNIICLHDWRTIQGDSTGLNATYIPEPTACVAQTTTYVLKVVDVNSCHSNDTVTVRVKDTTVTSIVFTGIPRDTTIYCGATLPTATAVTAIDTLLRTARTVTMTEQRVNQSCGYDLVRTWSVQDSCVRAALQSQTISVRDTQRPVFQRVPNPVRVVCGDAFPASAIPTAIDSCSNVTVSILKSDTLSGCTIKRTWVATDACGNSTTVGQIILLNDTIKPVIRLVNPLLSGLRNGDTMSMDCGSMRIFNAEDAIATDNCSNRTTMEFVDLSRRFGTCATDGYTILMECAWKATDACGNVATFQFFVKMTDNQVPILSNNIPRDTVINVLQGQQIPNVPTDITAIDNCTDNVQVTFAETQTPTAGGYILNRVWTATDQCGNAGTGGQRVTVLTGCTTGCCSSFIAATAVVKTIDNCLTNPDVTAEVCVEIPSNQITAYTIIDNGRPYNNGFGICATGSTLRFNAGDHTVIFTKPDGCKDTMSVTVHCVEDFQVERNTNALLSGTWCPSELGLNQTFVSIENQCVTSGGTNARFTLNAATRCVTYTGLRQGIDTACLYLRAADGRDVRVRLLVNTGLCYQNIVAQDTIPAASACVGDSVKACFEIPLDSMVHYVLEVDGYPYTARFEGCRYDTTYAYTYFTVPGRGNSGPYRVDSWMVNGRSYKGVIANINVLIDSMNRWDRGGNWRLNSGTLTIMGGNHNNNYGTMKITKINNGAFAFLNLNRNLIPKATMIWVKTGRHTLTFRDARTGCIDTAVVLGVCVNPTTVTRTVNVGQSETFCLERNELLGSRYTSRAISSIPIANVNFSLNPITQCVTFTGLSVGNQSAAFIVCDELGICDTTYFYITVRTGLRLPVTRPDAKNDTATTAMGRPVVIYVLNNDSTFTHANTAPPVVTILMPPQYGTATVNNWGQILFVPDANYCGVTTDRMMYVVCNGRGCDTAMVRIVVQCPSIRVNNGFSPNGDGFNDTFVVEGLEHYPSHKIQVFNRWGTEVFNTVQYKNSWDGYWDNGNLPEGTYFYVIDLGDGSKPKSGYIQIQR